jgi:hypothetical protein
LRAKGSNQEGILISSESRMDFDGWVEVPDVKRGVGIAVFIGFEVSRMLARATLGGDDGVASSEAGEEFVKPDCGTDGWVAATAGLNGTDWETRGELGIVDFVSG